jgi:[acyl-carrier-protein] S-malonyltransferase
MLAGHSLGEFGAWVASGALDFESALTLVRHRAELMAQAAQSNPGGMLAVIGLPDEQVLDICQEARGEGILAAANFNSPGQVVVSGQAPALEKARQLTESAGGRSITLKVSGAFHCSLMSEASDAFAEMLATISINDPRIPVVANAAGERVTDAQGARRAMTQQMTRPVLWTGSVNRMIADGIRLFVEVGPGRVLTNLVRRISGDVHARPCGTPAEMQTLLEEVQP